MCRSVFCFVLAVVLIAQRGAVGGLLYVVSLRKSHADRAREVRFPPLGRKPEVQFASASVSVAPEPFVYQTQAVEWLRHIADFKAVWSRSMLGVRSVKYLSGRAFWCHKKTKRSSDCDSNPTWLTSDHSDAQIRHPPSGPRKNHNGNLLTACNDTGFNYYMPCLPCTWS